MLTLESTETLTSTNNTRTSHFPKPTTGPQN